MAVNRTGDPATKIAGSRHSNTHHKARQLHNIFQHLKEASSKSQNRLSSTKSKTNLQHLGKDSSSNDMESPPSSLGNQDKGFSRSTSLSSLYALVVVLFGFVIPMSEALLEYWMASHFVAVFMVYLYGVSSLFLLYIHAHEFILRREFLRLQKKAREEEAETASDTVSVVSEHYTYWGNVEPKHIDNTQQGFNNLGMEEDDELKKENDEFKKEPIASSSGSDDAKSTTSSAVVPHVRKRAMFDLPDDSDTSSENGLGMRRNTSGMRRNMSNNSLSRRRFSTVPSNVTKENHCPDDVYNYIAAHMATGTMSHDGTTYFLKGGTLVFAIANMVYIALRIEGKHLQAKECGYDQIIYAHYLHLVFILLQTSFLIKDVEFVLRKHKPLVRFGLAHLVATNLCVWLRFLMLEVLEAVIHSSHGAEDHSTNTGSLPFAGDKDNNTCDAEPLIRTASPYLFPFILEYSLVAMSTAAFMFSSINIRVSSELYKAVTRALQRSPAPSISEHSEEEEEHSGQFAKSVVGLFLGVLILAGIIISMIFFFHWMDQDQVRRADLAYTVTETILLIFMLFAVVMAMVKFFKFSVDLNQENTFDHFLLLLSVAFYVILNLFKFFSTVAAIMEDEEPDPVHIMMLVVVILSLVQCVLQTVFLLDGMQRVYANDKQKREKRGRGLVTFLLITNVTAWIFKSFLEKRASQTPEFELFGEVPWSIISSVAIPMILFYRFHSSICLAHMWHHCYKKEEHHVLEKTILQ